MKTTIVALALFFFGDSSSLAQRKRSGPREIRPTLEEIQKTLETPLPPFVVTEQEKAAEERMKSWSRQAIPKSLGAAAPAVSALAPAVKSWDWFWPWAKRFVAVFAAVCVLMVFGKFVKLLRKRRIAFRRPDFVAPAKLLGHLCVFSLQALKEGYLSLISPGRITRAGVVILVLAAMVFFSVFYVADILAYWT